jgi:O-6-methylguanine DNA methyltransferase
LELKTIELYYSETVGPFGSLVLISERDGLCGIEFGTLTQNEQALRQRALKRGRSVSFVRDAARLGEANEQLQQYFSGIRKRFSLPIKLYGTPFQMKVWRALMEIPYGVTLSYKEINTMIGADRAYRAVGTANNRNPLPIIVPCHRVIGADGSMVGYGGGLDIKRTLLALEQRNLTG